MKNPHSAGDPAPTPKWSPGWERLPTRRRDDIVGVVVHRIEVSQEDPSFGDTPDEVARFFREHPIGVEATGGGMPYPLLIEPSGKLTQTLPLTRVTPHAAAHNPGTVGIGVIGDFRTRSPTPGQWMTLVDLAVTLLDELVLSADNLHGHDELAGGSRDPDKICPGSHIPMDVLRSTVQARLAARTGSKVTVDWGE